MKTNRGLLKYILLTIITCGIYAIYFEYAFARDMNIVCAGDGKKTRGVLAQIIFSALTLGIYSLVWLYGVGERINANSFRRNMTSRCTGGSLLLWHIVGSLLFGVGPFVALYKRIHGLNDLCEAYNRGHNGATVNVNVNVNA